MRLSDTLLTATQNLGRRKVRTVLTSVGVFVGIITIVTMVSLGVGIQRQITDTISELGLDTVFVFPQITRPVGGANPNVRTRPTTPLNPAAIERIKDIDGVTSVEVILSAPTAPEMTVTLAGRGFPVALREQNPLERIFSRQDVLLQGEALKYTPDERGLVLSDRLLRHSGFRVEEYAALVGREASITVTSPRGDSFKLDTTVRGVMSNLAPTAAELGNADKLQIKQWWYNDPNILETEGYASGVIHTRSLNDAPRVAGEVEAMSLDTNTLQTFLDQVNRIFTILQVMLSSVGLLALAVASIGIANTMIMSIYERTREIGTLKAIGSSNGDVLRIFMVEAGLIGLLGGIVGVIGGWLLGLALNQIILDYMKREQIPITAPFFVVTWELVGGALAFAALVGIVAGLYPAFRAARLDPLAALRHE
ncbi:MAG: putative transport system permease protein [Chloroflexia bacterium]|jgi:putative ABC transport system permease protein|nr:putative transport system permease protein [Chloroflexia bacterium]